MRWAVEAIASLIVTIPVMATAADGNAAAGKAKAEKRLAALRAMLLPASAPAQDSSLIRAFPSWQPSPIYL
jgi:hypothetical protein